MDPEVGSVRVIGSYDAVRTKVEIFTGAEHGWVALRGVTAVRWSCRATREGALAYLQLELEPLLEHYFESLTPPEKVAVLTAIALNGMGRQPREQVVQPKPEGET